MRENENSLDKYKEELTKVLDKSQDTFEKQLSYISAGALAISMTFIKDVVKFDNAEDKQLIIVGWVLLVLTLLVNFISHLISSNFINKAIDEINLDKYDDTKLENALQQYKQ
jgi:hypothetical protein